MKSEDDRIIGLEEPIEYESFDNSIQDPREKQKLMELLKAFADQANEGLVLLDEKGCVLYTNKKHAEYLNIPQKNSLKKHITKVTDNIHAHTFMKIIKTGERKLRIIVQGHGKEYIANQIPLMKNDKIIGAAGVILFDINELPSINKKMILLENRLDYYKRQLNSLRTSKYSFDDIKGESPCIVKVKEEAKRAARTDANILLIGESGTGKELFAHAVHNRSWRKFEPFVRVNCSAIPRDLMEAELFGYEPGAFTGALKTGKKGKFELAHHGSIFLDEIGDMPLQMQSELLRVLQEKEIDRIGSAESTKVDFRVIAATNKNLEEMIAEKLFREDLYYRINVVKIALPSLRERIADVPILVDNFLREKAKELGVDKISIHPAASKLLQNYNYPGNVRELMNVLERITNRLEIDNLSSQKIAIEKEDVLPLLDVKSHPAVHPQPENSLKKIKQDKELEALKEAIQLSEGNLTKCAEILGIHRTGVHRKVKLYNLDSHVLLARKNKIESMIKR